MIVPPLSSILSYTNRPPPLPSKWWQGAGYLLDGYAPYLAADFVRDRYCLRGLEVLAAALFTRSGGAKWVVGPAGTLTEVPANTLAFDYSTGRRRMLLEGAATNLFVGSDAPTAAKSIAVTAQSYTVSFWGTGSVVLSGAASGTLTGTGASNRVSLTVTATAGTLTVTPSAGVHRAQVEAGSRATSYIPTTTAAVTRVADICPWSAAAVSTLRQDGTTMAYRGSLPRYITQSIIQTIPTEWNTPLGMVYTAGTNLHTLYQRAPGVTSVGGSTYYEGAILNFDASGSCHGWDSSGFAGSLNGRISSTVNRTGVASESIGANLLSGSIDELVVWPIKGSSAAIQAQARVWA